MKNIISYLILVFAILITGCKIDNKQWTPDSSDLLFMSNYEGNAELYLIKAKDSTWINLTNNPASDNWGVWSPDGKLILFQSTRSGNLDIWVMNNDGTNPVQLTTNKDHDYLASFTPNGKNITFTSWRVENENEERAPHIYIMNSDGSNQRRLLSESLKTSAGAIWHPNSEKFIFTKKVKEKGADIFEADKNGKIIRQITNDTIYSASGQYSSDAKKILYTKDYGISTDIIIMNMDGSNYKLILSGEQNYYPHFSPDGNWIVYSKIIPNTEDVDINIYAVSIMDTTKKVLLAKSDKREAEGVWKPNTNN